MKIFTRIFSYWRVKKFKKIKKIVQKIVSKINIKEIIKRAGILSLTGKVAAFSIVLAATPAGTIQTPKTSVVVAYASTIKLNTKIAEIVIFNAQNRPEIKVGESNFAKNQKELKSKSSIRNVVAREKPAPYDPDLSTKRELAKKAAAQYGIDWKILEAVWQVESGKRWITSVKSYAGAQGPMQFMYGTWKRYAVDGNGDGHMEINNAEDAVYAGANLLAQAGAARGDYTSALLSYNHAQWYVDKVIGVASSITE
ncbi:hypothetical protein A3F08_01520 [Candidatus Berkelbacteria bacterium RIFCSPHIGHO2_12_FULL_36_9]|uniref:Transglycosylase SLT domain-containing protein n=1 Tax=Candidatus Berkelbacteria bacterium RIFCSPHIGHO2_12_FULL_36_9 TaxID=1797469 RepID=A0A1F5EKT1_9BACT|nr:MAG: hypothetical protein A3F08_01520 [Candidatus Berkelbacteria bacterium RIFCSPHIGHO2_12_FULL_36_9]